MHGDVQALVSPWAQPGVDFMHVGDGGEIEEDGRIEGHVEGVQWEVMLFSNVFFKFQRFHLQGNYFRHWLNLLVIAKSLCRR